MSKVKHLLRKLHIGGGFNEHQRLVETRPVLNPSINPSPNPSPSASSSGSGTLGRTGAESAVGDRTEGESGIDYNLLEEEFQVQLALAISASHPDVREEAESVQIDTAKRMSLGCRSASVTETDALVEFLSLRYWSYNAVNYDEKLVDGFYDVYGITSNSVTQGKMPLLVDLQALSLSGNSDYEVILVNRLIDPKLQELEKRVYNLSVECQLCDLGPILSGLIQKIADIVVERMGGPVGDADEICRRWISRHFELRNLLNTNILPLGCLDVGLSRHRALLFKVLADRIGLPCMLVKGSCYTGTDDGAVNLIRIDNGCEYIIDLMGAPGTLIPAEVPSSYLQNAGLDARGFPDHTETSGVSQLVLDKRNEPVSPTLCSIPEVGSSMSEDAIIVGKQTKDDLYFADKKQTQRFEQEFGNLSPSLCKMSENSASTSVQKKKVKNVSKYVISAPKNPGEQKVVHAASGKNVHNHAHCHSDKVLSSCERFLSSVGAESSNGLDYANKHKQQTEWFAEHQIKLEPNVIKSELSLSSVTNDGFVLVGNGANEPLPTNPTGVYTAHFNSPGVGAKALHDKQTHGSPFPPATELCQRHPENDLVNDCRVMERIFDYTDMHTESTPESMKMNNGGLPITCNGHSDKIKPLLMEVAEWEIPWEDLQIGERIGIGSYGEVYRADWHGTFKCEVDIMLRLRHPNVVLFMGAVTHPPHFSILTEFLPRGSLYRLLHRPNPLLDEKRRMRMALDVAKGMNCLHTSHPTIVHRDLKSPNLLVDKNWVVKVCDFGLSRKKHHTFLSSKSTAGTPEWMAPEVLRNERANEKCDVYSFGVILWELATLGIPWKGLNPMQVVGAVGFQNRRLEIPEDVDPVVAQIICDCWQTEPHLRPSFADLMSRLRRLQRLCVDRSNSIDELQES